MINNIIFKNRRKLYVWQFTLDNKDYVIKIKEEEKGPFLEIVINQKTYEFQKIPNLFFSYNSHKFNFQKPKNQTDYKLFIDSYDFDELNPNHKKQNEFRPDIIKKNKSLNPNNYNNLDSYGKLLKKSKEDEKQKRTGSDIYLSGKKFLDKDINKKDELNIDEKISFANKKENEKMKESDKQAKNSMNKNNTYFSQNNNKTLNKYKNKLVESEYVDELNEKDIPEYETLNEVIFNAY